MSRYSGLQRAKSTATAKKADAAKRKWVMEADATTMTSHDLSAAIYIAQTYAKRGGAEAAERLTALVTEKRERLLSAAAYVAAYVAEQQRIEKLDSEIHREGCTQQHDALNWCRS